MTQVGIQWNIVWGLGKSHGLCPRDFPWAQTIIHWISLLLSQYRFIPKTFFLLLTALKKFSLTLASTSLLMFGTFGLLRKIKGLAQSKKKIPVAFEALLHGCRLSDTKTIFECHFLPLNWSCEFKNVCTTTACCMYNYPEIGASGCTFIGGIKELKEEITNWWFWIEEWCC